MGTIAEARREKFNYYYKRVAERFGVSESYVQKIATGERGLRTEKADETYRWMLRDLEGTKGTDGDEGD